MFHSVLADRALCSAFLAVLLWAAYSDAVSLKIPNAATAALILLYPLHVLTSPAAADWPVSILVAAALFLASLALFARGAMGGGDVKLLTGVGLWAGPHLVLPVLLLTALAGGALALFVWLLHYSHRLRAAAARSLSALNLKEGLLALNSGETAEKTAGTTGVGAIYLPYGIAIAFGGAYAALQLLHG